MLVNEADLFASLGRSDPRLREWAQQQLDAQVRLLIANTDESKFRLVQGKSQVFLKIIELLDAGRK